MKSVSWSCQSWGHRSSSQSWDKHPKLWMSDTLSAEVSLPCAQFCFVPQLILNAACRYSQPRAIRIGFYGLRIVQGFRNLQACWLVHNSVVCHPNFECCMQAQRPCSLWFIFAPGNLTIALCLLLLTAPHTEILLTTACHAAPSNLQLLTQKLDIHSLFQFVFWNVLSFCNTIEFPTTGKRPRFIEKCFGARFGFWDVSAWACLFTYFSQNKKHQNIYMS